VPDESYVSDEFDFQQQEQGCVTEMAAGAKWGSDPVTCRPQNCKRRGSRVSPI